MLDHARAGNALLRYYIEQFNEPAAKHIRAAMHKAGVEPLPELVAAADKEGMDIARAEDAEAMPVKMPELGQRGAPGAPEVPDQVIRAGRAVFDYLFPEIEVGDERENSLVREIYIAMREAAEQIAAEAAESERPTDAVQRNPTPGQSKGKPGKKAGGG